MKAILRIDLTTGRHYRVATIPDGISPSNGMILNVKGYNFKVERVVVAMDGESFTAEDPHDRDTANIHLTVSSVHPGLDHTWLEKTGWKKSTTM